MKVKKRELEGDTEQKTPDSAHCSSTVLREPVDAVQRNYARTSEQSV